MPNEPLKPGRPEWEQRLADEVIEKLTRGSPSEAKTLEEHKALLPTQTALVTDTIVTGNNDHLILTRGGDSGPMEEVIPNPRGAVLEVTRERVLTPDEVRDRDHETALKYMDLIKEFDPNSPKGPSRVR